MSTALAFDLGTAVTRVADDSGAIVFEEPTVAARDTVTGRLVAFGAEAVRLRSRSAGRVAILHPVVAGKLTDIDLAELVVGHVFRRIGLSRVDRTTVVVCSHVDATQVQRRALERALHRAGVRAVRVVENPLAGAIGLGLAISEPRGVMVVDIGAGTTDIGVMALGGLVTSAAVALGGADLDEAVRSALARDRGLIVDRATAQALRRTSGALAPSRESTAEVAGRDALTGRVRTDLVAGAELRPALERVTSPIIAAAVSCITAAPPDVANDLVVGGLHLLGGTARMQGLDQRLASATGLPVHVPGQVDRLVVRGAARCLRDQPRLASVVPSARR